MKKISILLVLLVTSLISVSCDKKKPIDISALDQTQTIEIYGWRVEGKTKINEITATQEVKEIVNLIKEMSPNVDTSGKGIAPPTEDITFLDKNGEIIIYVMLGEKWVGSSTSDYLPRVIIWDSTNAERHKIKRKLNV